ncbi:MAG: alpha/beta hydrolase [Acidimicrobiia bacterium]
MPLDPAAKAIIEMMDDSYPRIGGDNSDPAALRAQLKALPRLPIVDECASVEDRTIPGPAGEIPVRIYRPLDAPDEPIPGFTYFHGGGWVICDLDSHDGACRRLANAVGAVVVSVDYRLAPEHPWPAASDDAYAATVWTAEHAEELGIDPARLAVGGDSAGGNLTAVVAQIARDRGAPPLAFQLLIYPVIDSTATRNERPSRIDNAVGYFLTTEIMDWYREQYLADGATGDEPYVSPHCADSLAGLPPACVVTGEMDILRDEGDHYAAALDAAGVPVTHHRADGMFHGFFNMDAALDGAKDAQRVAYGAARAALGVTA